MPFESQNYQSSPKGSRCYWYVPFANHFDCNRFWCTDSQFCAWHIRAAYLYDSAIGMQVLFNSSSPLLPLYFCLAFVGQARCSRHASSLQSVILPSTLVYLLGIYLAFIFKAVEIQPLLKLCHFYCCPSIFFCINRTLQCSWHVHTLSFKLCDLFLCSHVFALQVQVILIDYNTVEMLAFLQPVVGVRFCRSLAILLAERLLPYMKVDQEEDKKLSTRLLS